MPYADPEMEKAKRRNREHAERATASDITPQYELALRKRTRKCVLCGAFMTGKLGLANSKHLDHIVPVCMGGTHTIGNVRIICANCNLRRPRDGSDYTGPVTLWAQGESPVRRPDRRFNENRGTCRAGLHLWTPENILTRPDGTDRCRQCERDRESKSHPLHLCQCGAYFPAPGRQAMCWDCIVAAARKAAELHASGMTWQQVADTLGCYQTAEGARYAAKRIGYVAERRRPAPPAVARCACGSPLPTHRGSRNDCDVCHKTKALKAMRLRMAGWTLRSIADQLGYASITSVTTLLSTVMHVERRIGRPPNASL